METKSGANLFDEMIQGKSSMNEVLTECFKSAAKMANFSLNLMAWIHSEGVNAPKAQKDIALKCFNHLHKTTKYN